ncbi:MAG: hypothetical protein IPK13_19220 [Deltaproteobacteria bacterium]|nr:hypothetical protein [Deltaproteobacteria bacterium]
MGVLDILKRKTPLEKATKDLREPYAQPEYRRAAMDKLFEMGTDEAYTALLQRFTFNASGQIADEAEKLELVERLVEVGGPAVEATKRFIASEKKIAFPIRALIRMLPKAEALTYLCDVLKRYEPLDHRSTEAKLNLIVSISESIESKDAVIFVPYLQDHSDDVQFQAIGALERAGNPETRLAICDVCCSDAHAARIQRRAAQALSDLGWSVKERFEDFTPDLKSDYVIGKKGLLAKKQSAAG